MKMKLYLSFVKISILLLLLEVILSGSAFAQYPMGGLGRANFGHFYGKVIDSASGKAINPI